MKRQNFSTETSWELMVGYSRAVCVGANVYLKNIFKTTILIVISIAGMNFSCAFSAQERTAFDSAVADSVLLLSEALLEVPENAEKPVNREEPREKAGLEIKAAIEVPANDAFWKHDYHLAKQLVAKLLDKVNTSWRCGSDNYKARCLVNLSICEAQLEEWSLARRHSLAALKLAEPSSLTSADAAAIQARCLLMENKIDKAELLYKQAIDTAIAIQGPWNADLAPFYEGLAGCYMHKKNFVGAEALYKKVAQLDLLKFGPDNTYVAWSLLSLGVTERLLNRHELAATLYKKSFWNFRKQNEIRILNEHKHVPDQETLVAALRKQLYGYAGAYKNREAGLDYIKTGIPEEILAKPVIRAKTFDNWFKERVGRERAPGLAFFDPTKELKGLIVTVHGLGLHSGAFNAFAEQVQHEGFGVVSFDVRGFGSYRNDEVYQQLDLQAALGDIKHILAELRSDYLKTPIILLGESMGGAIVLRIAAEAPHLVDAVISSVPSGSRYQGKKTALKVGVKFLNHKHEQFNIGKTVVEQATANADLRDMWEGDSQMRMNFSPAELLNFRNFMKDNVKYAQKITKTPVIIFQGYSDSLVKPMGTLAIYQAIPNKDKDMIFLGRAEHLIFEEGQFDQAILKNVVEWITRHLPGAELQR